MQGGLEKLNDQLGNTQTLHKLHKHKVQRAQRNIQTPFDYQPDPFAEKANALRRKLAGNDYMHTSGYHRYDGLEAGSLEAESQLLLCRCLVAPTTL